VPFRQVDGAAPANLAGLSLLPRLILRKLRRSAFMPTCGTGIAYFWDDPLPT